MTSFVYPTECTTRLFYKNVKTYIKIYIKMFRFNPLNDELNTICPLLALFGAHHILHVSR